ncbi:MAG TPA: tripartite tricarboxylate transporter substrate-binding protein [Xanthobacteraceae bacterium]|nr:tripartite tricarboxylate transporter substrate-binding protein [Xanthobacteraceae bacterium]
MKGLPVAVALAVLAGTAGAAAQSYPSRPITMIVPFAAGGVTDIVARIVSERMKTSLGQSVIVENVSGAGGTIGVTRLYRAPADGYTLAVGQWTSHVGAGAMYPLPFNYLNDFEPVSMLSTAPLWIIGRSNLPAKDLKELIAWLKANPDKASAATTGLGSGIHMCLVYFQNMTGTKFPLAPYRGAAPLMQDLLAGQIDLSCPEAGQTLPQYRAGGIKAYAVLTEKRWFAAPDVPTIDEAGVPGLHFPFWHGLWAPKGTPKDVIARLNVAAVEALADAGVRQRFNELGHEIVPREQQTPEALAAYHKAEIDKWWPIIKAANIKLE